MVTSTLLLNVLALISLQFVNLTIDKLTPNDCNRLSFDNTKYVTIIQTHVTEFKNITDNVSMECKVNYNIPRSKIAEATCDVEFKCDQIKNKTQMIIFVDENNKFNSTVTVFDKDGKAHKALLY